jgi:hypothetical protein
MDATTAGTFGTLKAVYPVSARACAPSKSMPINLPEQTEYVRRILFFEAHNW